MTVHHPHVTIRAFLSDIRREAARFSVAPDDQIHTMIRTCLPQAEGVACTLMVWYGMVWYGSDCYYSDCDNVVMMGKGARGTID